jgi:hypothetical protein
MRPLIMTLSTLALAACAQTPAQTAASAQREAANADRLAVALTGLTPRKSTTCLPLTGTQQSQTQAYGQTILYKYSRGLIYRSDTAGGCERIARGDILVTRQVGGQLCAGDIATTIDSTTRFQTGSCSFGPFTAYRRQ